MDKQKTLRPFTRYLGSKRKLADKILDIIYPLGYDGKMFYDLCCGGGAITMAAINRGVPPHKIVMLDAGYYGEVWERIGNGTFDIDYMLDILKRVPFYGSMQARYLGEYKKIAPNDCYHFLLFVAVAYINKLAFVNNRWMLSIVSNKASFAVRDNNKNPSEYRAFNKQRFIQRLTACYSLMRGVRAYQLPLRDVPKLAAGIVYIDPPYKDTTGYKGFADFDLKVEARNVLETFGGAYISEYRKLSNINWTFTRNSPPQNGGMKIEYLSWVTLDDLDTYRDKRKIPYEGQNSL